MCEAAQCLGDSVVCVFSSLFLDATVDDSKHQGKIQAHISRENIFTFATVTELVFCWCVAVSGGMIYYKHFQYIV